MEPVYFSGLVPPMEILEFGLRILNNKCTPHASSPFVSLALVMGSKEILSMFVGIAPDMKRLSVTVGIVLALSGDKVPT